MAASSLLLVVARGSLDTLKRAVWMRCQRRELLPEVLQLMGQRGKGARGEMTGERKLLVKNYATAIAAFADPRPAASFAPERMSNSIAESARARSGQAT